VDRGITSAPTRLRLFVVLFGAVIAQTLSMGTSLCAQTLVNPNPPPRAPATAAQPDNERARPCPLYGPGFVQLPGSSTCVKIGGSVQVQGSGH
jgi:hypothetical protein